MCNKYGTYFKMIKKDHLIYSEPSAISKKAHLIMYIYSQYYERVIEIAKRQYVKVISKHRSSSFQWSNRQNQFPKNHYPFSDKINLRLFDTEILNKALYHG